jgi:outer membrane protein OmpA-like peptidoglycan-associated protein
MNASSFKTMPLRSALAGAVLIALVAGCSTMSAPNATLDRAHAGYRSLQADQQAAQAVPTEMAQADEALRAADAAWTQREQAATIEHLAYLAQQRVAIARETAATRTLEKAAAATKMGADADKARTDLAAARQNTQDKTTELALTKAGAQQDRARATDLEAQLREINAKQTDRGDIVSLGDVLFESNRAEMSVSGRRDMSRLVAFMKQHPKRAALIEGFTDSQGGQAANVDLSQRRAMAVRDALVEQGVFADRLSTHGYGDAHPVASNATAAGRQMNRRVEIVLSRDDTMAKGR